ncbi:hypothetical protein C8R45DRAFT_934076 [Mycena sanguinolenta]|nr:hypothetical protein C8R45DRAFT_934076 [Mycena sanguinolenta]
MQEARRILKGTWRCLGLRGDDPYQKQSGKIEPTIRWDARMNNYKSYTALLAKWPCTSRPNRRFKDEEISAAKFDHLLRRESGHENAARIRTDEQEPSENGNTSIALPDKEKPNSAPAVEVWGGSRIELEVHLAKLRGVLDAHDKVRNLRRWASEHKPKAQGSGYLNMKGQRSEWACKGVETCGAQEMRCKSEKRVPWGVDSKEEKRRRRLFQDTKFGVGASTRRSSGMRFLVHIAKNPQRESVESHCSSTWECVDASQSTSGDRFTRRWQKDED